jgi:pSer/pThr/pTyr-binding forkhead associated (FHA) protein
VADGPILVGTDGFVRGVEFPIDSGAGVTVGRSRSCELSLQRLDAWTALSPEEQSHEKEFKSVSRKHVRISVHNDNTVEIEDLSSNGTFVDGKRIKRIVITDLPERSHEVLLGTRETFRLEWRAED